MSNLPLPSPPAPIPVRRAPVARADCGLAAASDLLGDRWALLVIREAFYGVSRFDDLAADLGAPRAALSDRLRTLCDAGVLEKVAYREAGRRERHEYRLTACGRDLALPLLGLMVWGDRWLRQGPPGAEAVEAGAGRPLRLALVDADGRPVEADRLRLVPSA